jgi:prevent-host-death family protein
MKTMPAGSFKTHCLSVIDEVNAKHETVIITKHGKPMAKLVPIPEEKDSFFGFMRGRGRVVGDLVEPIFPAEDWDDAE